VDVRSAVAIAVEEDPHAVAIQKAIPAVSDRLRTMTGVIQNGQITHAQALRSLEGEVKRLAGVVTDFVQGTYTMQFTPRSALEAPPPLTGASFGPAAPVPLPQGKKKKYPEV